MDARSGYDCYTISPLTRYTRYVTPIFVIYVPTLPIARCSVVGLRCCVAFTPPLRYARYVVDFVVLRF